MTINDFSKEILNLKSAVIFCHARPDGDTLSCAFALYYAFERMGKSSEIVCSTEVTQELAKSLPFLPKRVVPEGYDAYVSVDTPSLEQLGELANCFLKGRKTYSIDHHVSNTRYAKKYYIENKPSCTLVLLEIIKRFPIEIDKTIASFLTYGLITDTLGLTVRGLDAAVFDSVSELIGYGADYSEVFASFYRNVPREKMELFARALGEIKYYNDGKIAVIYVSEKLLAKFGNREDYTIGLVDYLTRIEGVDVGISILQTKDKLFRISFRSNFTNVNEIAEVFGGGGHKYASGAVLSGYFEDVLDRLLFTVGNYLL